MSERSVHHDIRVAVAEPDVTVSSVEEFLASLGAGHALCVGQELHRHQGLAQMSRGKVLHVVTSDIDGVPGEHTVED